MIKRIFPLKLHIFINNIPHRKIVKYRKYKDGKLNHQTITTQLFFEQNLSLDVLKQWQLTLHFHYNEIISRVWLADVSPLCPTPAISELCLSGQRTEDTKRTITGLQWPSMLSRTVWHQQCRNLNLLWGISPGPVFVHVVGLTPAYPKRNDVSLSQSVDSVSRIMIH